MRLDIPHYYKDGDYELKLKGGSPIDFWELSHKGVVIESRADLYGGFSYMYSLMKRLSRGEKLNWMTKFKSKWF